MNAPATLSLADLDGLLSVADVEKLLRVKQRSVYAMIKDGRLPQPLRLGRQLYWRPADVEEAVRAMPHGYRSKKKNPGEALVAPPPGSP